MSERIIGTHADCGGNVIYVREYSMGRRYCDKCKADGYRGTASPSTVEEAEAIAQWHRENGGK